MSAWIELYEDYRDKLKLYQEVPDITPVEFMRKYAWGLRMVQRSLGFVRNVKQCPALSSSPDGTIYDIAAPPLGQDVDAILLVKDPYGAEVYPASYPYFQDTVEMAQVARNDFPRHYARFKPGTTPPQQNTPIDGKIENRIYWRLNRRTITVYPEVNPTADVTIYYIVDIPAFTQSAPTLWGAFFPLATNFEAAFTQPVPPQFEPLEEAALYHAIYTQLQALRVPSWQEAKALYNEVLEMLRQNRPSDSVGNVSPYGILP